jgi:hypothetical protein
MGISLNSGAFNITDGSGNTKFSLNRRMSHILYNTPGVISIPKILALDPRAKLVDRSDEFILINNSLINTDDYFVMPFYRINGGVADSGSSVISGSGSIMVREILQPSTGIYLGSSIITTIVEPGYLKLVCKHKFDKQGFANITGDDVINIAYRIYYGRFK